ncbi:MAG: hypothetical protein M3Z33_06265 [Actinomycetota bacterium]|nr:hypothetical protein [Actinomycetota bacterium]
MRAPGRHRRAAVLAGLTMLLLGAACAPAQASRSQRSIFQDDNLLEFQSPTDTARTLDTLRFLGVDTVRVSVFWNLVAPGPDSSTRPSFDATDPAAYPAINWARYDQVVALARQRGINVDFNISPPVPGWAGGSTENTNFTGHFRPSASEFGQFVRALGRRYSGSYLAAGGKVPRVSFWSLWNEPNGVHFLAPPWERSGGRNFESAARIYRSLADAGYGALSATGHGSDTILVGETAPKGQPTPGQNRSLRPLRFIRALYCVDRRSRPLRGRAASLLGCPTSNQATTFAAAHPALFRATGWGHHPYQLLLAPAVRSQVDSVSTADIPSLTSTLDRAFSAYRQRRRIPIYFDEYGYETNPPASFGVSLGQQVTYLNQAEFMAYRNPRVRTYSQFLLMDYEANDLFQSGLVNEDGSMKPAFGAYRIPIFIPATRSRTGRFRVWGLLRPGNRAGVRTAAVQFRANGAQAFATVATAATVGSRGYVDRTVTLPGTGQVRLAFRDPATGQESFSRSILVAR